MPYTPRPPADPIQPEVDYEPNDLAVPYQSYELDDHLFLEFDGNTFSLLEYSSREWCKDDGQNRNSCGPTCNVSFTPPGESQALSGTTCAVTSIDLSSADDKNAKKNQIFGVGNRETRQALLNALKQQKGTISFCGCSLK